MASETKQAAALRYASADRLLHVGLIFSIQRGSAEILYAGEDGVLLQDTNSGVHMLAAANYKHGLAICSLLDTTETMLLHQQFMVEHVQNRYSFADARECVQAVYTRKEPLPLCGGLEIKQLDTGYLPQVLAHYHAVDDPRYVTEILHMGGIYGGFAEGKLCGFVGCHLEGSMGLLEVFPEYRCRGYAQELESYMVNLVLAAGMLPYGHVLADNEVSLRLQAKLGFAFSEQNIYWMVK